MLYKHILKPFGFVLLILLLSSKTLAAPISLYQVEILAFAYQNPTISNEIWPEANEQPDLSSAIELADGGANNSAYQKLPDTFFHLKSEENKLIKNGNYRILLHEAWLQPITLGNLTRAPKIHIIGNENSGLDGTLTFSRSSYFDMKADFMFNSAQKGNVTLKTTERLRANELFYLDHPFFGMLILIKPQK